MENISYTVEFKYLGKRKAKGKILKVIGDGFTPSNTYRWFITSEKERYEIPTENMIFFFSRERDLVIKMNMEKESGQVMR